MRILKEKVVCPHCGKEKHEIETEVAGGIELVKKVGKARWHPLLRRESQDTWTRNMSVGLGIECKCGRMFFAIGIGAGTPLSVSPVLSDNLYSPAFCIPCQTAFISQDLICPTCKQQW